MATIRLLRDQDCPRCNWPETYTEIDDEHPEIGALALGCSKCDYREESFSGFNRDDGKRVCFYIPHGQCDEHGYIPSVVTEGEPGHSPLSGDPAKFQTPWYWGDTYERACSVAARMNEKLGLTQEDADRIVMSSMAASLRR